MGLTGSSIIRAAIGADKGKIDTKDTSGIKSAGDKNNGTATSTAQTGSAPSAQSAAAKNENVQK
jgi:hypothetical protein